MTDQVTVLWQKICQQLETNFLNHGGAILARAICEQVDAVEVLHREELMMPCLIVTYSTIDAMASLNRPVGKENVTRADFLNWVSEFMIPESGISATPEDLYAARCATLHTNTGESRLSREGKAREIVYATSSGADDSFNQFLRAIEDDDVLVCVSTPRLVLSLMRGIHRFLDYISANPLVADLVHKRARSYYGDVYLSKDDLESVPLIEPNK